jgi:hypothetical protein
VAATYNNAGITNDANVTAAAWNVPPGNPDPGHLVSVYYTAIPLDPAKTVQFITLATNLNLHVFAMSIGKSGPQLAGTVRTSSQQLSGGEDHVS